MTSLSRLGRGVAAGLVAAALAGVVGACSPGAERGGVCGAYLRFNDAIAEAHDVDDLRRAAKSLAAAVPSSATGEVSASKKALEDAVADRGAKPQSFFDAAAGIATSCQFEQDGTDLQVP